MSRASFAAPKTCGLFDAPAGFIGGNNCVEHKIYRSPCTAYSYMISSNPDKNEPNKFTGWTDVDLSEKNLQEAIANAMNAVANQGKAKK